jgi:hypothetical protein
MSAHPFLESLGKRISLLGKIPFLSVVVLALMFQAIKEFYPFSHYPMYSVLTPTVEFYYLTNAQGKVVPQKTYFGFSTSWTRKMLNTRLSELSGGDNVDNASPEEMTLAGQKILGYLSEHCEEPFKNEMVTGGLQLHQIFIRNTNGRLLREDALIAEIPPARGE